MSFRVTVIADHADSAQLVIYLRRQNADLDATVVTTLDDLERALGDDPSDVRLISFCSSVIVPGRILDVLGPAPYNIHPASPAFPGSHPDAFAVMADVSEYGATAHEMVRKVDEGAIVDVELFPVMRNTSAELLRDMAFVAAVSLYARIAAHCALSVAPLPAMADQQWGPRKTTRKDYQALCETPPPSDPKARDRLERACGADLVRRPRALAG